MSTTKKLIIEDLDKLSSGELSKVYKFIRALITGNSEIINARKKANEIRKTSKR